MEEVQVVEVAPIDTKHYFSKSANMFYAGQLRARYEASGSWPSDAVEVSEEIYQKFIQLPPEGKKRGVTKGGKPTWVSVSRAEIAEQEAAQERYWRNEELYRADKELLKSEDGDGVGEPTAWRKYRVALRAWPANPDFPDSTKRPIAPDAEASA